MLDNGLYICNISLVIATIENPTRFLCSKQEKGNLKYLHKKIGHYEKHDQNNHKKGSNLKNPLTTYKLCHLQNP